MKKAVSLVCVLLLLISFAGCSVIKRLTSTPEERTAEWVEAQQGEIDTINRQYEGTIAFSLEAEGRNAVISARYLFLTDTDGNLVNSMGNSTDAVGVSSFVQLYKSLHSFVGNEETKLILRYYDSKGKLLVEREIDEAVANAATEPQTTSARTLKEYVMGEQFQASLSANDTEDIKCSALMEGDTVVVLYTLTEVVDRTYLEDAQASWNETFSTDEMRETFLATFRLLKQSYPDEMRELKLRITDPTGVALFEKTYSE